MSVRFTSAALFTLLATPLFAAEPKKDDPNVSVWVRLVTLSDECARRERPALKPIQDAWTSGAELDNHQLRQFLDTVQLDEATSVMQAPVMTVRDGERSHFEGTEKRSYVTDVLRREINGTVSFQPKTETFTAGFKLTIRPTVGDDGKCVRFHVGVHQTTISCGPRFPVVCMIEATGKSAKPKRFIQYVQQPAVSTMAVDKFFSVADRHTFIFHGWSKVESRVEESDWNVLEMLPLIGDWFAVAPTPEFQHVFLLVTPTIVTEAATMDIQEEEEGKIGGLRGGVAP